MLCILSFAAQHTLIETWHDIHLLRHHEIQCSRLATEGKYCLRLIAFDSHKLQSDTLTRQVTVVATNVKNYVMCRNPTWKLLSGSKQPILDTSGFMGVPGPAACQVLSRGGVDAATSKCCKRVFWDLSATRTCHFQGLCCENDGFSVSNRNTCSEIESRNSAAPQRFVEEQ